MPNCSSHMTCFGTIYMAHLLHICLMLLILVHNSAHNFSLTPINIYCCINSLLIMQAYSSILLVWQTKSKTEFEPTKQTKRRKKAVNSGGFGHSGAQGERQRQGHSNTCDIHNNLSVSCSLVLHENKLMLWLKSLLSNLKVFPLHIMPEEHGAVQLALSTL